MNTAMAQRMGGRDEESEYAKCSNCGTSKKVDDMLSEEYDKTEYFCDELCHDQYFKEWMNRL